MEFDIQYIAVVLGVILVSMTLHEAMHGFVAYWLGDDTAKLQGRLTLNPLKHIDPFLTIILPITLAVIGAPVFGGAKPVPFNPQRVRYEEWGAALVALAGPLMNLVLAFIGFAIYAFLMPQEGSLLLFILGPFIAVNLGFFAFNILPVPPLDGSRVMYALAPDFIRRGMEWIEKYGIMLVFFIVLVASEQVGMLMSGIIQAILRLFAALFGIA